MCEEDRGKFYFIVIFTFDDYCSVLDLTYWLILMIYKFVQFQSLLQKKECVWCEPTYLSATSPRSSTGSKLFYSPYLCRCVCILFSWIYLQGDLSYFLLCLLVKLKGVKKKIRSFALWRLTPLFFIRFSSYAHQIKAAFPTILTIIITFF